MFDQGIKQVRDKPEALPSRPRWMLVDDTPAVLETVATLLETLGYAEVRKFGSSLEALEAFTVDPNADQLIVTDLDMPGMNGLELCSAIHQIAPTQKILLVTGSSDISEIEASGHGFCGMLKKPFLAQEMVRCLETAGIFT